jgi:hypothetical protein
MSIALITSIYGNHDWLVDPPEQDGVTEYIAVVDQPQSGSCGMWTQIVEPRPHLHPRMAAKVAKCRPDLYASADYSLWIDGSARLKHKGVAEWAVGHLTPGALSAQFPHPERIDIEPEAYVSQGMSKYDGQAMLEQVAHYRKEGLPLNYGLWATGFIARSNRTTSLSMWGRAWLEQQTRWTYQDQLSLPYVMWRHSATPAEFLEGNLWSNPHVHFEGHR